MQKTIWISLLVLSSISLSNCATFREVGNNRENLKRIEIGMSRREVTDIMGDTFNKGVLVEKDGRSIEVLRYPTEYNPVGPLLNSETEPICFQDNKVIGWGRQFYNNKRQKAGLLYP